MIFGGPKRSAITKSGIQEDKINELQEAGLLLPVGWQRDLVLY
jgi:hypothetical protein